VIYLAGPDPPGLASDVISYRPKTLRESADTQRTWLVRLNMEYLTIGNDYDILPSLFTGLTQVYYSNLTSK
jgi:hypothetical protein